MKITSDKLENSQAYLTIEMEPAELEESLKKSYTRLVKRAKIPGFRPGKAPRDVFERYVGKASLMEDALNNLIPEAYKKALAEKQIEAFAQPSIEVLQTEPVIFKAVVPLKPTVKLGDYHSLGMVPEAVTVTDENVDNAIEQLRHQHATWEPVERDVKANDMVVLDIDSSIEGQSYIKRQGAQYQVLPDLPLPAPGFAQEIAGMKRDEAKEFKLTFPKDYPRPELADKEANFKVKVLEIKQEKLPELTDDFAKEVSSEFKSLQELKEKVKEDLKVQLEERARLEFEDKVVSAATDMSKVEFPPVLIEIETDELIRDNMRSWQIENLEEYLKNIKKTEKELRDELKGVATKRVTRGLVLGEVAEAEKLTVSDSEVDAEIENSAKNVAEAQREAVKKALTANEARESIKDILLTRKTMARLAEIAKSALIKAEEKEDKK